MKETAQKELAQRRQIKSCPGPESWASWEQKPGVPGNSAAQLKQVLNLLAGGPEYAFLVNLERPVA
jgi:hypothetical protein